MRFHTVRPADEPPTARAAAVGVAYSLPSSMRSLPSEVTVATQRSPLRGRSHTKVSPAISSPASSTWAMLTRLDVGEEAVAFTLSVSSFNVDKSVSSAS